MNATKIEYLNFTWSPFVGCSGLGCAVYAKCWARYQAMRRMHSCKLCYQFKPHTHFERLVQPLVVKTSKRIGVCFSADFWDKGFTHFDRARVFNVADHAKQHWFINLTKQTQNIPQDEAHAYVLGANWVQGASICTEADLHRVKDLLQLKEKGWIQTLALSIEPLYKRMPNLALNGLDWIIIGGQTHPLKLPDKAWVDEIIIQAHSLDIPVFVKNNLPWYNLKEYPKKFLSHDCEKE